jgi:RNA 2',3'-cyclic 3'-phosphodiesterase
MHRLFFALQPSAETAARVLAAAAPTLAELQAAPVPVGNLHATLCFMGAVAPERLGELLEVAARIRACPVELRFDEFDHWDKPRVLCACASRESAEAAALSIALHEAAIAAGFPPDAKTFRAHLTLARKIDPTRAEKFAWPQKISPGFVVRCDEFVLMESRRDEHGSIYSVVASWPLYGKEEC